MKENSLITICTSVFLSLLNDKHGFVGVVARKKEGKLEPDEITQVTGKEKLSGIFIRINIYN